MTPWARFLSLMGWMIALFRRPQDLPWMLAGVIVPARLNRRLNR